MQTESEIDEIQEILEKMTWEEIQETLMHVELLVAEKKKKMVFSDHEVLQ